MPGITRPIIFSSYSHDSDEHRERVLGLSEQMRTDGYETRLDQYVEGTPAEGWARWMLNQLDEASHVLVVCTETYYLRFRGQDAPNRGRGADWEGALITQAIYDSKSTSLKFVPVLFDPIDEQFIPEPLRGLTHYTLNSQANYDALREFVDGAAGIQPAEIGEWMPRERRRGTPLTFPATMSTASNAKPNTLPFVSLGSLFKGRDEKLAELRRRLDAAPSTATALVTRQAIYGLGGIGKTRLAIEYAWQHEADYTALLFVTGETPESLNANLAALVRVLHLPEQQATEQTLQVEAVLAWVASHPGWLLILDNVDTHDAAAAVEKLLPRLRAGHVLVTSRQSNWSAAVQPLELDVLDEVSSVEFLLERTNAPRDSESLSAATALAHELGGLALALEQASAYVLKKRITLAEYLTRWQAHQAAVQEWYDERLMQYPRSVAVTWQTTLDQLQPGEVALLNVLAWLASEPIPLLLLESKESGVLWREGIAAPDLGQAPDDSVTLLDALATLADFSMVKWKSGSDEATVHRVVQEILRNRQPKSARREWLTLSLRLLMAAEPGDPQEVPSWPRWDRLRPHIAFAIQLADELTITEPTSLLMSHIGLLFLSKALYAGAEPLLRRALAIDEQSYGAEHPHVATRLNNLASLLRETKRLTEAEPLNRRALAIDEKYFGTEHATVAVRLNNLALLLKDTNHLAEAEPLMRRALAINEKSFGTEHASVATVLNNLATLLQDTNRLTEAEPLMRRGLAIEEKCRGADHPFVATQLTNLALLLQETNRLAKAEPLMRRALVIDEKSFGPDHPKVAIDLNNLGLLLKAKNRLAKAEPLLRRALAINEKSFGPNHSNVALNLNNLAMLLQESNRMAEAEPLIRRALAIDEQSFGPDHPDVARDLHNLAQLLVATNRPAAAGTLMRRIFKFFRAFGKATGYAHPRMTLAIENYCKMLAAANLSPAEINAKLREVLDDEPS